jgi:DNA mismatch repair protein MutH
MDREHVAHLSNLLEQAQPLLGLGFAEVAQLAHWEV